MNRKLLIMLLAVCVSGSAQSQFTDSVWIVGGNGEEGELVSVEVWLQFNGAGPPDSIALFDIPLTYDATVCTVETITLGPDFSAWLDKSRIDNTGAQGPPAISKIGVSTFTFGPPIGPAPVERGTHLAATVDFRILDTAAPGDSSCIDTLMQAFSVPIYLGFVEKSGWVTYAPAFSTGCVRLGAFACGDCSGDGFVNFGDALYVKNYYYQTPPGSPPPIGQADVNLDGHVNFADALYIKNYYYQTPPGSPAPCEPPKAAPFGERRMEK